MLYTRFSAGIVSVALGHLKSPMKRGLHNANYLRSRFRINDGAHACPLVRASRLLVHMQSQKQICFKGPLSNVHLQGFFVPRFSYRERPPANFTDAPIACVFALTLEVPRSAALPNSKSSGKKGTLLRAAGLRLLILARH